MEKVGYRDNLEIVINRFGTGLVKAKDAAEFIGIDERTLKKNHGNRYIKMGRFSYLSLPDIARIITK